MTARRRRQQSGSILVLVAAMSLLLVGFVGLSVDGGEIEAQQRQSQNAADGAALAAATAIINASNYGYSTTDAQTIAQTVASYSGIPISEPDQTRARRLLAKRREIKSLIEAKQQGRTIVPLQILTHGRFIKLKIAVGQGKKRYDKRQTLRTHDQNRDINRQLKRI